jgi:hypothetical protein
MDYKAQRWSGENGITSHTPHVASCLHTMAHISLLFVLSAITLASASVLASNSADLGPSNANCTRSTYPITVTSSNIVFSKDVTTIPAGVDATTFVTSITEHFIASLPTPGAFSALYENNGTRANVTGTYNISGTLCTPKNSSAAIAPGTVQLLIHGGKLLIISFLNLRVTSFQLVMIRDTGTFVVRVFRRTTPTSTLQPRQVLRLFVTTGSEPA